MSRIPEGASAPFSSFHDFYPFYLSEHRNRTSRRLHFIGTALVIAVAASMLATANWWLAPLLPLCGYSFAWAGHFFFEKNKPATFRYPLWSLIGDFVMFRDILVGKIRF